MKTEIILDEHRFYTPEGLQTYYANNRETHLGVWELELIADNVSYYEEINADANKSSIYDLLEQYLNFKTFNKYALEDGETVDRYDNEEQILRTFCFKTLRLDLQQEEILDEDTLLREEECIEIARSCAEYDIRNGKADELDYDSTVAHYQNLSTEELIYEHQTKYEYDEVVERIYANAIRTQMAYAAANNSSELYTAHFKNIEKKPLVLKKSTTHNDDG